MSETENERIVDSSSWTLDGWDVVGSDDVEQGCTSGIPLDDDNNTETASDALARAKVAFPHYNFDAMLPSNVDIDDEDDPVWSNDAEKAYFDYILEREIERRCYKGKNEQDSLIGRSTLEEIQGGQQLEGNFSLGDNGMHSLSTGLKTDSMGDRVDDPQVIFRNFDTENGSKTSNAGSLPRIVYLTLADKPEDNRNKRPDSTGMQHGTSNRPNRDSTRGRGILIFCAGISCTFLILAFILFLVAYIMGANEDSFSPEVSAATTSNSRPSFSENSNMKPSLLPSPSPTILPRKTHPPNGIVATNSPASPPPELSTISTYPTMSNSAPPTLLPKKTHSPSNDIQLENNTTGDDVTALPTIAPSSHPSAIPSEPVGLRPFRESPAPAPSWGNTMPTYYPVQLTRTWTPTPEPLSLGLCKGDCDTSDDCSGDLICYQRSRGDPAPAECPDIDTSTQIDFCVHRWT